jgi:trans-aconitate methyltransferase
MRFVNEGHLGGFVARDAQYPNGDPMTYTPAVWQYLLETFNPLGFIDVGCGEGHAVRWFRRALHPSYVLGIDGCKAAIDNTVAKGNVMWHDFTQGPSPLARTQIPNQLIWSCEFVEHVEEKYLANILDTFNRATFVAMTHAFPGQPGHHHVNCQLPEYWVEKMKTIGFRLNREVTDKSRELAEPSHWKRSGLVFERELNPESKEGILDSPV